MLPNIEWSFNAYTVGTLIFAIAGFYWLTTIGMKVMKEDVTSIKQALGELTKVVVELAVQKKTLEHQGETLVSHEKLIGRLEDHVFRLTREHRDGEYTHKGKV
jgi:uncharacterized coiled-coil protein SlyX